MKVREGIGVSFFALGIVAGNILALIIHVYSIVIAFSLSGIIAAVITFILPGLSELYWFFKIGSHFGFDSLYCVSLLCCLGLYGVMYAGMALAGIKA